MKNIIKTIITILIIICIAGLMQNNIYAYEENWEQIKKDAYNNALADGKSMSAETLKEKIESFQKEIDKKSQSSNYDSNSKAVDERKMDGYKNAYFQKTGETYSQSISGNGNIGSQGSITDPILNPSTYDPTQSISGNTKTSAIVKIVVKIMTTLGIGIAIISLMIIGIRFMVASVEERAKYKETMVPYIIGAILLFTISSIIKILSLMFFNIGG